MVLGYARASTTGPDLARQVGALTAAGLDPTRIHVDRTSGADRPGLRALLESARDGDVIVAHTLDRLGHTVRETVTLIDDLHARASGCGPWPIRSASTRATRTIRQSRRWWGCWGCWGGWTGSTRERAAHARAVATATSRRPGRPSVVTDSQLAHAVRLRDRGATMVEIVAATELTRSTLYRHLPPCPLDKSPYISGRGGRQ